jgi:hypothetical protein
MGEGQATENRSVSVGKETFLAMAAAYQRRFPWLSLLIPSLSSPLDMYGTEDGSVEASFQVSDSQRPSSLPTPLLSSGDLHDRLEASRVPAQASQERNRQEIHDGNLSEEWRRGGAVRVSKQIRCRKRGGWRLLAKETPRPPPSLSSLPSAQLPPKISFSSSPRHPRGSP